MKYKLDETDLKNLETVRKITHTDYKPDEDGCIDVGDLTCIIDELLYEIDYLKDQYKDLQSDLEENYKPRYRDKYEEYGISERDFY